MKKTTAQIFGIVATVVAIIGFFSAERVIEIFNSDLAIDWFRFLAGIALLYAGFMERNLRVVGMILSVVGAIYVVAALWAMFDNELGGLAPSEMPAFDIAYHLLAGALFLGVGLYRHAEDRHVGDRIAYNEPTE